MISERSKLRRKTEFHAFECNHVHAIVPHCLYLTNYRAVTHHPELLYELGIDAIVSVLEFPPFPDPQSIPIEYADMARYHFQIEDNANEHITRFFQPFQEIMRTHRKVLIHCYAGMSRSAAIVIAYLMSVLGSSMQDLSVDDIVYTVQQHRPCVSPNHGFLRELEAYRLTLLTSPHV